MSIHQKNNGTWFVQYRVPGVKTPRREYCGVGPEGLQRAKIRNAEVALDKASGRAPRGSQLYLDDVAQSYILDRKLGGASVSWLKEMAGLLNRYILPGLTAKPVDDLTYQDVLEFVDQTWGSRKIATRQRYMGYMKALFRFGVEHGHTTNNPLAKWRKVKERRREMRLTVEDLARILAEAPKHLAWAIEVEWELGTRPGPSELFTIRWCDVDFKAGMVSVHGTKTEGSDREIPITPAFREKLLERRKESKSDYLVEYKGKPVLKVCGSLRRAARRAGVEYPVRMYDIRHLFASSMLAQGADLAAVSKILGHSSIVTTQQHYYHVLRGEKARAVALRPQLLSPVVES